MWVRVCVGESVSESKSESEGESQFAVPATLLHSSHMSKSHDSLHLSRNLSSSTITNMSKVLHLPRKLHDEAKQLRSLAPVTKSRNTRFPLRLPRKVTTMCKNAHGTTTRAQSLEAPAVDTQIQRACAVEVHMDDVESHES